MNVNEIVERVDEKFRPVWENCCSEEEQWALAQYFLCLCSRKPTLRPVRPKVIKWYCPFAHQHHFPSGHRYCVNTYTGCTHNCVYCYARGYEPDHASCKKDFEKMVLKDLADLRKFSVPAAPIHFSNSTDALQPLEVSYGQTKFCLQQIIGNRDFFTTVTILTKNPELAASDEYVQLLRELTRVPDSHPKSSMFSSEGLPGCQVEVSLAFWNERARTFYDPAAPTIESRKEGILRLREAGIPVVLRVDPLFPRSPLPNQIGSLPDFGLVEAQTMAELEKIVAFAADMQVRHMVFSPLKLIQPRRAKRSATIDRLLEVYKAISSPGKPPWRGGSWRLPREYAESSVIMPFKALCDRHGVKTKFCMKNLVETV